VQLQVGATPEHHRRDDVPRTRGVVVEEAEHLHIGAVDAELLPGLAARRVHRRFAGIDPAAGQRPLARVGAHLARPATQHERGTAGHTDHLAVDHVGHEVHPRYAVRPARGQLGRVGVVVTRVTVDEQDGDRGVAATVQPVLEPLVAGEVGDDRRPQPGLEGDHAEAARIMSASIPS
jgi:hypothetical protein